MRKIQIEFPDQVARAVFPVQQSQIAAGLKTLSLESGRPVIVLIGGMVFKPELDITKRCVEIIAETANTLGAVVISGGTKMGVMYLIGATRQKNGYDFPLLEITVADIVTWHSDPKNKHLLWWGKKLWPLDKHYSHFVLTLGNQYGDESPWIVDAAKILAQGSQSVTVLINGGNISRLDIQLSVEAGRQVVALSGTGRYADELAEQPDRNELIEVVSAEDEKAVAKALVAKLI